MSKTRFTKMHGAGNDFVVFDATRHALELTSRRIARIADRHLGIGCDQVLVVENSELPEYDFVYRIFNADGGEVEQCGNGARAFVRFVIDQHLTDNTRIRVLTKGGVIEPHLLDDGSIEVDMGPPVFEVERVPFLADELLPVGASIAPQYRLELPGQAVTFAVASMGNPHAVLSVENVERSDVQGIGAALERHRRFPERVNVGFMQIKDRRRLALRVFERGVGETLACGTGACAAAAVGIAQGLLDSPVCVATRGGELSVRWDGHTGHPVFLSGPAVTVFEGEIDLASLDSDS
jgi:diaminopimelate epimerase